MSQTRSLSAEYMCVCAHTLKDTRKGIEGVYGRGNETTRDEAGATLGEDKQFRFCFICPSSSVSTDAPVRALLGGCIAARLCIGVVLLLAILLIPNLDRELTWAFSSLSLSYPYNREQRD